MTRNTAKDVAERLKQKHNGTLEYLSGYKTKESTIKVRCTVCGETFERTYHHLTTHPNACPMCKDRERSELKRKREELQERAREERSLKAKERKEEKERRHNAWVNRPCHECAVCGAMTRNLKYCSSECRNKAANKAGEHRRRMLLSTQMVDTDISVRGLYKRDGGTCAICCKRCDFDDYIIRDGNFIAGDWYPSIDHIKPLSRGGLHSWANVQLAHRRCNAVKSDKII